MAAVEGGDGQDVHEGEDDRQEGRQVPELEPVPFFGEHVADGSEAADALRSGLGEEQFEAADVGNETVGAVGDALGDCLPEIVVNLLDFEEIARVYLELDAERQRMRSDKFIETSTWKRVNNVCNLAIQRNAITRIIGPSQIGKTHSLREYQRRAKFQCAYLRIPAAPTFKLCVDAFCEAVGVSASLRIEEARPRIAKAVGENTLLMVDELHELIMSAGKSTAMKVLEWIREIWDNSHCGMCLCGTSALEDDLINDPKMKGWLGQLDQRCIRVLKLPNAVPMEDVVLAGQVYGIKGSTKPVENLLRNIRMNRLTTILAMTEKWCSGMNKSKQKHPLNWESFAQVYNATFEGEVR